MRTDFESSDEALLTADPDVVAAWTTGWALSRGAPPPIEAYGGLRVDVGLPEQKARIVFASPSAGLKQAARTINEANVFLKVCAPPQLTRAFLTSDWEIKPLSFMMVCDVLDNAGEPVGAGYEASQASERDGGVVEFRDGDGDLAASGRVFFSEASAIFDRIETSPKHRRQGLGRAVMATLSRIACQRGMKRGLLVATPDGRGLYNAMGWKLHSLYTSAVRYSQPGQ
jgi:GNAT superfamily N-acetyltransferase